MTDESNVTVFDFNLADPTFKIADDADEGDFFSINVGAAGATTITTVDDDGATANLTFAIDGDILLNLPANDGVIPSNDNSIDLGSAAKRYANIHTAISHVGDLHLENDRGNWLIVEEENYLSIRNQKTGKLFKFVLEEIEE